MGTSNFHNKNASAIFVIDYEDDEFAWSECQHELGHLIKTYLPAFEPDAKLHSQYELRSFPSSSIGCIDYELTYLDTTFQLRLSVFLRSGYYEAANLDWEIELMIDYSDEYDDVESIIEEISYDPTRYDIKPSLWTIHKQSLIEKLNTLYYQAIEDMEKVFVQISEPYGVTDQFSNGETIYHKLGA